MKRDRRADVAAEGARSRTPQDLWLAAALVACVAAVFGQVRTHQYVEYDIAQYITANPYVLRGWTSDGVKWALTTGFAANWHPVTWLSHMLDVELFGVNPGAHHLVNVGFHAANTVLVFLLLVRTTARRAPSWIVAFLFAMHPMHVESVAWVVERKDVLSTFFGLLCLLAYCRWTRAPSAGGYIACCAALALGLMSKPMLVTFPCVMLLLDKWPLMRMDRGLPRLVLEKLPMFALSAASSVATVIAQRRGGALSTLDHVSLAGRAANAVVAYVSYLEKTFWPIDLAAFYPLRISDLPDWRIVLAVAVLLAITATAYVMRARGPYLLVGWLWFLGTLVPVIGIVQVGSQSMADRYSYVPLIGVFFALVWMVSDWDASRPALRVPIRVGTCLVGAGLTVLTWKQVGYWKSTRTLAEHALAVTKKNHIMHNMLGFCLLEGGDPEQALTHFRETLRVEPHDVYALDNMSVALVRLNRYAEAEAALLEVLRIDPNHAQALNHMGGLCEAKGDFPRALEYMQRSVRLQPDHAGARNNLGYILERLGRLPEAEQAYRQAIALRPGYARPLLRLGSLLASRGDFAEAERYFQQVLTADPSNVEAQRGLARSRAR